MNKQMIMSAATDLFGYDICFFEHNTLTEILDYLDFDQLEEIKAFYGYRKLVVETY